MGFGGPDPDPAQCEYYAAFAAHLGRVQFDAIYWVLFCFVVCLLFASSWHFALCVEKASKFEAASNETRVIMKKCIAVCSLLSVLGIVSLVMEVYALLALQFCDGEDLMSLYWSTWTTLQLGSLVAMFGIILAATNQIRGRKNPPWALAMGTPVLVVAGIGHVFHDAVKKRAKMVASRSRSHSRRRAGSAGDLPLSRQDTVRQDDSDQASQGEDPPSYQARFIGYTPEGGPIIQFLEHPGEIDPSRGDVLGQNAEGMVTVLFHKDVQIVGPQDEGGSDQEKPANPRQHLAPPTVDSRPRAPVVRIQSPVSR